MAKRFVFKLQALLSTRKRARDAQRRVLADAMRAARRIEQRIEAAARMLQQRHDHARVDQSPRSLESAGQAGMQLDVQAIRRHHLHMQHLHQRIADGHVALRAQEKQVEQERQALAELSMQLKIIEKLREKRYRQWLEETRRQQRREEDEMAIQRFARRQHEEALRLRTTRASSAVNAEA